jgi:hypothetical protein
VNVEQWRLSYNQLLGVSVHSLRAKKVQFSAFVRGVYFAIAFPRLSDGTLYHSSLSVSKRTTVGLKTISVSSVRWCLSMRFENFELYRRYRACPHANYVGSEMADLKEGKEWLSL